MFFSSFSPEICILLSKKQHVYRVFFLNEAGHIPSSDARADTLQEAIWFARSWRLAGVISRSEPLVVSPQGRRTPVCILGRAKQYAGTYQGKFPHLLD